MRLAQAEQLAQPEQSYHHLAVECWSGVTGGGGGLQQEDHLVRTKNFGGKGRLLSEPALRFCIRPTWG